MKKLILSAALASAVVFAPAFTATADNAKGKAKSEKAVKADKTLKVNTASSKIVWNGKKVAGEHSGNINIANGNLLVAKNKLVGGTFDIDMNSITVTDITDPEYNGKLVGHLKNDDFFATDKFPKASFKITSLAPIKGAKAGQNNYNVTGDLTIKGITKPVTFPADIKVEGNKAIAKGVATVDRSKYDVKYASKSFFDSIGDKAIDDNFTLNFNVVAQQ
ncbi:YceI family protein [Adhaeribacter sp. BT258]|uniref:YceI family protein n=1 Tax=Adhaeribacter terrigena TaxID=2793070 RepID=A0ABS1BY17_9BACT|nr:YceI family protein [Adhaeribacter terrigena]MBK0402055.1 YceI family protein [Adhaeribacter terrigena]